MSGPDFDPYLKWLGIRDPERPPNHYRLLGIELLESDPEVVQNAADARMAHLRTFQTGPHSELSQRLLNEIAIAKVCLLNAGKKAKYDAQLQAARAASSPPASTPDAKAADGATAAPAPAAAEAKRAEPASRGAEEGAANRETVDASLEETLDLGSRELFMAAVGAPSADVFATPKRVAAGTGSSSPVASLAPPDALDGLTSDDPLAGLGAGLTSVTPGGTQLPVVARRKEPEPTNFWADWLQSTAGKLTLAIGVPLVLGLIVAMILFGGGSKPRKTVAQTTAEATTPKPISTADALDPLKMQPSPEENDWRARGEKKPRRDRTETPAAVETQSDDEPDDAPTETTPTAPPEPWPQQVENVASPAPGPEQTQSNGLSAGGLATAFIDEGRQIATVAWDGVISVRRLDDGTERTFGPRVRLAAAAFSPTGEAAMLAGEDGSLELWDLASGERVQEFESGAVRVTGIAFSRDGRHAATVGLDDMLRLWRFDRKAALDRIPTQDVGPRCVACSPAGRYVAIGSDDGRVRIWNVDRRKTMASFVAHQGAVRTLAFSPAGDALFTGGDDGVIAVWKSRSGLPQGRLGQRSDPVRAMAFTPDGRWLVSTAGGRFHDGNWSAPSDPALLLWNVESRVATRPLVGHGATVLSVAFSPVGPTRVASTGFDSTVRVWSLPEIEYAAAPAVAASDPADATVVPSPAAASIAPLTAGLTPADLYPGFAIDAAGWLATTEAAVSTGPNETLGAGPAPPPGIEKFHRSRDLPAPRPLLTTGEWETYKTRFAEHVATVARSGSPDETKALGRELLGEAQLASGDQQGMRAFLIARAFGLAAGRRGDMELAGEAAMAFQEACNGAPPELRMPLAIARAEIFRELARMSKRLDKSVDVSAVHMAVARASLHLAATMRLYGFYDEAKKALNDGAFSESLKALPETAPGETGLRDEANEARRVLARWTELRAHVQKSLDEFRPDDPQSKAALGRVFLGQLANLELAAPLLAEGSDPSLADVGKKYAECRQSPAAYYDLAEALRIAAAPGTPEQAQAVLVTIGAEAARRFLETANPTDEARERGEKLARVLNDRAAILRPKFFPPEALSREPGNDSFNSATIGSPANVEAAALGGSPRRGGTFVNRAAARPPR